MSRLIDHAPSDTLADVQAGRLPERYRQRMQDVFLEHLQPLLVPGVRILDVGSGRTPSLGPEDRPEGCHYIGLDIAEEELLAAGPGAYDESFAHDITKPLPAVRDVDLVISWQVLEHVSPLPAAFANLHATLRPGGTMLVQLSGSHAAFAVAAHVIPRRLAVKLMVDVLDHPPEQKFPTEFDDCHPRAFRRMLSSWSSSEIVSFYRAAPYFGMSRPLQRIYLGYENLIASRSV
jgi:SAM-dependent methyltransferase